MSDDDLRGIIQNRKRSQQIIDFSALREGKITPTDIDGSIDWHNQAWVFTEFKYGSYDMRDGQRLFYERLCNDLSKIKPTIILVVNHDEPPERDIVAGTCLVGRYYYREQWHYPKAPITLQDAVAKFYKIVEGI